VWFTITRVAVFDHFIQFCFQFFPLKKLKAPNMLICGLGGHLRRKWNPAFVTKHSETGLRFLILSALCFLGENVDSNITDKRLLSSVLAVNETISFSDENKISIGQCLIQVLNSDMLFLCPDLHCFVILIYNGFDRMGVSTQSIITLTICL
jgi:hypothetical protein